MRIQRIEVDHFKSLVNFRMDLAKFNCVVGLNGAGKSTLLQWFDFQSQLVRGDIRKWLSDRDWELAQLQYQLAPKQTLSFSVCFSGDDSPRSIVWTGTFDLKAYRCTAERIKSDTEEIEVRNQELHVTTAAGSSLKPSQRTERISFKFEGSVLSQLDDAAIPKSLFVLKKFLADTHSLELLSPELMRNRTRKSEGSIGTRGERLAAFLAERGEDFRERLRKRLEPIYPRLGQIGIKTFGPGWKQLETAEQFETGKLTTGAGHINDGMLRLIAIMAELETDHGFILFDEIENGVNPEITEFLLNSLVTARQQILVTTHSPLILNFLADEDARRGVIYLYKTAQGATQAIRFFDIPSMASKLKFMGPGEVYVDTNLTELAAEIERLPKE